MNAYEQALNAIRRRLAGMLILREVFGYLTLAAFLLGTVVLVIRIIWRVPAEPLWWACAGLPAVIGIAAFVALRRLPARESLRALLDQASGCGGLLLAGQDEHLGTWENELPPPAELRWRWHAGRPALLLACGAAFLCISLLFPDRLVALGADPALEIGKEVAKLSAQVDVLKKEGVLEPERADSYQEKLDKIKKEASGTDPVKTLEALDHLAQLANKKASEAAESATAETENLAKAEALAEGLREAGDAADAKVRKEAMGELSSLMQKASLESKLLGKFLDAKTVKDALKGSLTPEELKKLAKALGASRADLLRLAKKLHEAKLIDIELLRKCLEAGMCDGKGMCKALLECEGGKSVSQMLAECQGKSKGKLGGRGGTAEGPGHNSITWTGNTSEDGTKFKEETLPPGALASLKDSKLMGVGVSDPGKEKSGGKSASGGLNSSLAGGGSANTPVVLPRHRKTVERYFKR